MFFRSQAMSNCTGFTVLALRGFHVLSVVYCSPKGLFTVGILIQVSKKDCMSSAKMQPFCPVNILCFIVILFYSTFLYISNLTIKSFWNHSLHSRRRRGRRQRGYTSSRSMRMWWETWWASVTATSGSSSSYRWAQTPSASQHDLSRNWMQGIRASQEYILSWDACFWNTSFSDGKPFFFYSSLCICKTL